MNCRSMISKSPHLAQRMFKGRMLVVTVRDGMLHRMNEVATFIWTLLDTPRSITEICRAVVAEFSGVDEQKTRDDVMRFVEELHKRGLVSITPSFSRDVCIQSRREHSRR